MISLPAILPLVALVIATVPVGLAPLSPRLDRLLTRISVATFGAHVTSTGPKRARRKRVLQSAHVSDTYRAYAARTLFFSGLAAIVGSVVGVYLIAALSVILPASSDAIRSSLPPRLSFLAAPLSISSLSAGHLFVLLLLSSATLGLGAGAVTYLLRWWWPRYVADVRGRKVDESLARTVAFVFALSRSGMAFPQVLRTLSHNRDVYGEAAEEFTVAVKEMDLFGEDMLSAVERAAIRSPSEEFGDFTENLSNVLQSGRSVSQFLNEQYERYQEEAESRQEQFLELLGALAEGYVSLFVVGPLLLITILEIIGLMGVADTREFLRLFAYLIVPLGNLGFIVYLDSVAGTSNRTAGNFDRRTDGSWFGAKSTTGAATTDDGAAGSLDANHENVARLRAYDRIRSIRRYAGRPIQTILERPLIVLYATVPVAVVIFLLRLIPLFEEGIPTVGVVDDLVVQSVLLVLVTFGVAQELHKRRLESIEEAIPDFLDRMAGVNEAGMTVVESLQRVTSSDLGALNDEVERLWADIDWSGTATGALYRFEARVRTVTVSRVVTLLANAMEASGNLGPVLRIAADNAQEARRLKRKRRQEMLVYLLIVYLSFVVFLVIIGALDAILVPNLPSATGVEAAAGSAVGPSLPISGTSEVNVEGYTLLFFHTALIQGLFSGLVAGQMGEENVRNGAKHAAILVSLAYLLFLVLP